MILYVFLIDQHTEDENFYISYFGSPFHGYVVFLFFFCFDFCIINTSNTTKPIIQIK